MNRGHRSDGEEASDLRQLLTALLVTLISVAMLLGSFLLARLDPPGTPATPTQAVAQRSTITPFLPTFTPQPAATIPGARSSPTSPATGDVTKRPDQAPSPTPTVAQPPTVTPGQPAPPRRARTCVRPPGWLVYTVRRGDTLTELARRSSITILTLTRSNCLGTTALFPGQHLYVPPSFYASPTPEPYPCGPPLHWVVYIVQPDDTLYSLADRFDVEIETLLRANCLQSDTIYIGQALYVPPLPPTPEPTDTSTPTPSPSLTPTTAPTPTPTSAGPTPTATATPSPTSTSVSATATPSPMTPDPTSTPTPTAMPPTISPTATSTQVPTATSTATSEAFSPTATSTSRPTPTQTSSPAPTATETPLSTATSSATSGS